MTERPPERTHSLVEVPVPKDFTLLVPKAEILKGPLPDNFPRDKYFLVEENGEEIGWVRKGLLCEGHEVDEVYRDTRSNHKVVEDGMKKLPPAPFGSEFLERSLKAGKRLDYDYMVSLELENKALQAKVDVAKGQAGSWRGAFWALQAMQARLTRESINNLSKTSEIELATTKKVNSMANRITGYESMVEASMVDENSLVADYADFRSKNEQVVRILAQRIHMRGVDESSPFINAYSSKLGAVLCDLTLEMVQEKFAETTVQWSQSPENELERSIFEKIQSLRKHQSQPTSRRLISLPPILGRGEDRVSAHIAEQNRRDITSYMTWRFETARFQEQQGWNRADEFSDSESDALDKVAAELVRRFLNTLSKSHDNGHSSLRYEAPLLLSETRDEKLLRQLNKKIRNCFTSAWKLHLKMRKSRCLYCFEHEQKEVDSVSIFEKSPVASEQRDWWEQNPKLRDFRNHDWFNRFPALVKYGDHTGHKFESKQVLSPVTLGLNLWEPKGRYNSVLPTNNNQAFWSTDGGTGEMEQPHQEDDKVESSSSALVHRGIVDLANGDEGINNHTTNGGSGTGNEDGDAGSKKGDGNENKTGTKKNMVL